MSTSEWRWAELKKLQEHYTDFRDFYADCSEELLGFTPSDIQYDIAHYIANGPYYSMAQAQRGQAKTTITGCYAVWCLIHDPTTRILIVSAGAKMAKQISTWCIQIINHMPELECLRCDTSHPGARASVEAYDVHWELKGSDKSPSIACMGITASIQGFRADLLIADDIESSKNALTEVMREQLQHLTLDFTSINSNGRIIYLGTPQSVDSIYNRLPGRGFNIRIWPGRYPTEEQEEHYGEFLAPIIKRRMEADPSLRTGGGPTGDMGQPTDPVMMDEYTLTKKQIDQGLAYFNLQFMLDTALMDADRYPLKLRDLMVYVFDHEECPGKFIWGPQEVNKIPLNPGSALGKERLYAPAKVHDEYFPYSIRLMSIDPAGGGQNGDETGVSILYECNGYIIIKWVTGIPGGTTPERLNQVADLIKKFEVNEVIVEKNYGNGAYGEALKGVCLAREIKVNIEEVWASGQKEQRIIDNLEPPLGAHKVLIDQRAIEHDVQSTEKYPLEKRSSYQFLFQLAKLTRDRGSLLHDDRLDSVAQGVAHLMQYISKNADQAIQEKKKKKLQEFMRDPFGAWRFKYQDKSAIHPTATGNALSRFTRKKKE